MKEIKIFALSESLELGDSICKTLNIELGKMKFKKCSDGEILIGYDETIRARKIYIIGSTPNPESIIEMLLAIDAAKRAGAKEINVVMPYAGYSRQDRRDRNERGAIGASMIANIVQASGADSLITVDLHASQIEGFYRIPVVHIQGTVVFVPYISKLMTDNWVICSPDAGGVARASSFSQHDGLNLPLVVMNKKRDKPNSIQSMVLIGDVVGKNVMVIDDMVDTGGSLSKCVDILLEKGAITVSACITHPVLSGKAVEIIENSNITKLYVSDTIRTKPGSTKIEVVSSAEILATVIHKISYKESVKKLTV